MARRCVGYEGTGRSRKPVWLDEGPARARPDTGFGLARFAEVPAPEEAGELRAVERRQITDAEIAARRRAEEEQRPSLTVTRHPSPEPREPMQPPVTPPPPQPEPLVALVHVEVPCASCVKADVCRIRDSITGTRRASAAPAEASA